MADSTLAALTAATAATGGFFYGTQSGLDRKFTLTAAGAALIEAADAAAQRTALAVPGLATANTFTSAQTVNTTALGTTPASLVSLVNTTAAAAAAQQVSPMLVLKGQGWKTTATAASQSVAMSLHTLPVQGTTAPTGELVFSQSINGGSLVTLAKIVRDSSVVAFKLNNGTVDLSVAEYNIGGALTINASRNNFTVGGIATFLENHMRLGYLGNLILRNGAYTSAGVAVLQMGDDAASPIAQTFKAPNGSGTNIVGGKLCLAPGQSTGNANPAILALQGTAAGSSGTTAQTLVDVLSIIREGVVRITGIPTSSAGLSTGDIWSNAGVLTIV